MPQVPSSHSFHIRKQVKLFPNFSKSLTNLTKAAAITVAELLKPHDIAPPHDLGSFGDVTVVFETKKGTSKLVLSEVCGRQVVLDLFTLSNVCCSSYFPLHYIPNKSMENFMTYFLINKSEQLII